MEKETTTVEKGITYQLGTMGNTNNIRPGAMHRAGPYIKFSIIAI